MVVGGLFALSKAITSSSDINKTAWGNAILQLQADSDLLDHTLCAPTSVCYELMSMNRTWKDFILTSRNNLFTYATYNISNQILQRAAEYSYSSRAVFVDNSTYKSKSLDPITAAYSLENGYPIITENQKDFAESHFTILAVTPVVLQVKQGRERRLISLLAPKIFYANGVSTQYRGWNFNLLGSK